MAGRVRLAETCGARDECPSMNLGRMKQEEQSEQTVWAHGLREFEEQQQRGSQTGPVCRRLQSSVIGTGRRFPIIM